MKKSLSFAAKAASLSTIAALALVGCSSPDAPTPPAADAAVEAPGSLVQDGTLTYGVAATFPPFEFREDNTLTGFDIEMAEALAGYLGLAVSPLDIDFDGLIPALNGGRVDIINSAMYMNEERAAQVDFVPYMVIGEALLVPEGNALGIKDLPADLSGRTIAVTRGAIGETYMVEFNRQLEADGLEPMEILSLPTNQDALMAVKSGRADAFDTSTPGAAFTLTEEEGVFEVAATFELGTKIGMAIPKGSSELAAALKEALELFVADGAYASLLEKYNLPADSNLFQ